MPSWSIILPTPPSVNAMYVNRVTKGTRGRMISPAYKSWLAKANGALWMWPGPIPSFSGKVSVLIEAEQPTRYADIDGRIKAVLDFLVKREIIEDDDWRYVREVTARWDTGISNCRVTVMPLGRAA